VEPRRLCYEELCCGAANQKTKVIVTNDTVTDNVVHFPEIRDFCAHLHHFSSKTIHARE